jgi:renal tumor antigen
MASDIGEYRVLGKLGEGTFSEVMKVKNKLTGKVCALKRFKKRFNNIEEIESLREIQALRRLNNCSNMIQLEEVLYDAKYGVLSLVFELMEANLYEVLSKKGVPAINEGRSKWVMFQLVKALEFVHGKGIFHRDIKPENILVRGDIHNVPLPFPNPSLSSPFHQISSFPLVKMADFGSCRGVHSKVPYTEYIATRWYRAPECLLFEGVYGSKMDVWGLGCVFFELLTKMPLFPGDDELDQLSKIHAVLGSPSEKTLKSMVTQGIQAVVSGGKAAVHPTKGIFKKQFQFPFNSGIGLKSSFPQHILLGGQKYSGKTTYSVYDFPGVTDECVHLIEQMLIYDQEARPTARQVLKNVWFKECIEAEITEKLQEEHLSDKPVKDKSIQRPSIPVVEPLLPAINPPSMSKQITDDIPISTKARIQKQEKAPSIGPLDPKGAISKYQTLQTHWNLEKSNTKEPDNKMLPRKPSDLQKQLSKDMKGLDLSKKGSLRHNSLKSNTIKSIGIDDFDNSVPGITVDKKHIGIKKPSLLIPLNMKSDMRKNAEGSKSGDELPMLDSGLGSSPRKTQNLETDQLF